MSVDHTTFLELAKPSKALNKKEERLVLRVCESSKEFLKLQAQELINIAENRPILYHYGSDGTLLLSRKRFTYATESLSTTSVGGAGEEFLVERAFLKTTSALGEPLVRYLGRDPRPLTLGKGAWNVFGALCGFFPLVDRLRALPGITVYSYVFDRALLSSLDTKLHQRHLLYESVVAAGTSGDSEVAAASASLSWVVVGGCALHDCHNSLHWGLRSVFGTATVDYTKSMHTVVEALRNGHSLLHCHLSAFVIQTTTLDDTMHDCYEVSQFWVNLGVEPGVAEILGNLNPRWVDGQLRISTRLSQPDHLHEQICYCLAAVACFKSFTDSRWLTIGDCCRSLLCSSLLGLDAWVALVRSDPSSSDFYLHGFDQYTQILRKYICIAAVAAHIPDAVLGELLQDDRVALHHDHIIDEMNAEVTWLQQLPHCSGPGCHRMSGAAVLVSFSTMPCMPVSSP